MTGVGSDWAYTSRTKRLERNTSFKRVDHIMACVEPRLTSAHLDIYAEPDRQWRSASLPIALILQVSADYTRQAVHEDARVNEKGIV